jgi:hypothetical protein
VHRPVSPPPFLGWIREQLPTILGPAAKVDPIATREKRDVRGRHSVRAMVDDPALMAALLARARRSEATLNDLLMAVSQRTIAAWNAERDAPSERLRIMLISNLRTRIPVGEHAGAGLAPLNLPGATTHGLDLDAACRRVRDWRTDQLARGNDVALYRFVNALVTRMRVLPMALRHRILRPIVGAAHCTLSLSNVGVVWPKVVNGRPTAESLVTGAGDFEIDDLHSSPSLGKALDMGLVVRTHRGRFYLNFTTDRREFHKDETVAFRDRFMETLTSAA